MLLVFVGALLTGAFYKPERMKDTLIGLLGVGIVITGSSMMVAYIQRSYAYKGLPSGLALAMMFPDAELARIEPGTLREQTLNAAAGGPYPYTTVWDVNGTGCLLRHDHFPTTTVVRGGERLPQWDVEVVCENNPA